MVDARNAMLAADQLRFNGVNQDIMWNAFAKRGLGQAASSNGDEDFDPVPSLRLAVRRRGDGALPADRRRVRRAGASCSWASTRRARTPIADTDPGTPLSDTFKLVPGTYELVARGAGFGARADDAHGARRPAARPRGQHARSTSRRAPTAPTATGDGINLGALIDDTEATNWASLGSPVAGKQVTVGSTGARSTFAASRSARMLRHRILADADDAARRAGSRRCGSSRCWRATRAARSTAAQPSQFTSVFTSAADAFPSAVPRPRAPELIIRSFAVPETRATHVRLRVLTNQCTGAPAYQGDQDDDPRQRHRLRRRLDAGRLRPRGRAAGVQVTMRTIATIVP